MQKNVDFPSGIFLSNAKQKKPIVFLLFRGTMKSVDKNQILAKKLPVRAEAISIIKQFFMFWYHQLFR